MLQEQLKSFMYVDHSLRGNPKKDKLIYEFNFTNCMHLRRIQKSKFFVGITVKQRRFTSSKQTRISSWKNKDKRGDLFRTDKNKVKISALEWDDFVLQAQLKSFMYVDHSLRGDTKKYKLIDELNFTNFMQLKRIQKSSSLLILQTNKQRTFIIHPEFMVAKHKLQINLFRISEVTQTRFMTWRVKWRDHLKTEIGKKYQNKNTQNHTHHWQ